MRRADRLMQIVQIMRRRGTATTARMLADELEVVPRTIYRDIADLQGTGVPIDGEAGVGYVLRQGYDLPPLMFSETEVDAIVVGARMVIARGDAALARAAQDVLAKMSDVLPNRLAEQMRKSMLYAASPSRETGSETAVMPAIRDAIRRQRKLAIAYVDLKGQPSTRTIWPLAVAYFPEATVLAAWCELRNDTRAFRSDRVQSCTITDERFDPKGGALLASFMEGH
jgi:predicted DNA-binding transcriptional regulator YafY